MTDQRTNVVELSLRGRPGPSISDNVDSVRVAMPAVSWNTSTMLLHTLRDRMHRQGWDKSQTPEIPCCDSEPERLPRRPLDLGVGQWR